MQRNVLVPVTKNMEINQRQACGLSSQAPRKESEGERKNKRTEEEARKVAEHKAAVKEYRLKMTALRKEIQKEVCSGTVCTMHTYLYHRCLTSMVCI